MDVAFAPALGIAELFGRMASLTGQVWFFVLPALIYPLFMYVWMNHIIGRYEMSLKRIVLELIPPKELEKGPQLMEMFYDGLAGTDKGYTTYEQYVLGENPPKFSFEVAGDSGRAHLYIWLPAIFRNLVEANLYARYPDVEIIEVNDYVREVPRSIPNKEWSLWASDLKLTKADAYPIKTYRFFEEPVTGEMIDPMASLIEVMGKLPPGQRIWLQYIVSPERPDWSDKQGRELVDEIVKGKKPKPETVGAMLAAQLKGMFGFGEAKKADAKDPGPIEFRLTPVQRKVLEAVESNIGKNVFKVRMRFLYLGRVETFNKGAFLASIFGTVFKPYNDANFNSFGLAFKTSAEHIMMKSRILFLQRQFFRRYCDRDRDSDSPMFILSSTELATLFHLPDGAVQSPALSRVVAKRSGSPSNLPI